MSVKRKAILAAVLALAGTAITVLVGSGPASAQENARVCGVYWEAIGGPKERSITTWDVVFKLYEVPKGDTRQCEAAKINQVITDFPMQDKLKQPFISPAWSSRFSVDMETCEAMAKYTAGDSPMEAVGDGFPATLDSEDICKNMEVRSASATAMQPYWVYVDRFSKSSSFITRSDVEDRTKKFVRCQNAGQHGEDCRLV